MRTRTNELILPSRQGESAVLARIRERARSRNAGVSLGIGDDCALIRLRPGEELAVTTDLSIEGRHFRLETHPPDAIGHRTLARGLSDIASMGARPVAAFLSLGLPKELIVRRRSRKSWLDSFLDGFLALAAKHSTPLAGGDLAESPVALADIVLVGAVRRGAAMLRSGARAGDLIYATGTLGGSAAGLAQLTKRSGGSSTTGLRARETNAFSRYLFPEPRIKQGLWLSVRRAAAAAIDLSDGLSTDLDHLCTESGTIAEIDSGALPIHPEATLEQALNGGEDYELLFTAPPRQKIPRSIAGLPVTRIGRMLPKRGGRSKVTLMTGSIGRPLTPGGWEHFS